MAGPRVGLWASAAVLAAQAFRFPSGLRDAVTGAFLSEPSLIYGLGYLLTAPFSAWADLLTFNSARQHAALAAWLLFGYWVARAAWLLALNRRPSGPAREIGLYLAYLGGALAFLAWAALAPRPLPQLYVMDPDTVALDFHSHSNRSWDGRRSFTPAANMEWHRRAGFRAAFITDHNQVEGSGQAKELSRRARGGYSSLEGVEVSLDRTHLAVLGISRPLDRKPYEDGMEGVRRFLGECGRVHGGLAVLSLPEYWRHHWERLDEMAGWGAAGIELVNAAPKALDMPLEARARVVEIARARNLFLAGVSDNHGWAQASYVWSLMRIPGHEGMDADRLEAAVLERLKRDGFSAVTVVERVKHAPASGAAIALDPWLGLWTTLRTLSPLHAAVTLAWIWGALGVRLTFARRR